MSVFQSSVLDQVYKETYRIFLLYEHVFSVMYEDGSSVDNRHRMQKVLGTPPVSRLPFTLDRKRHLLTRLHPPGLGEVVLVSLCVPAETNTHEQVFSVYLGNIPHDVTVEEVWVNLKPLLLSEGTEGGGYSFNPVVHTNGSRAFELRLPFLHDAVRLTVRTNRWWW